jgi:hypothetical protein
MVRSDLRPPFAKSTRRMGHPLLGCAGGRLGHPPWRKLPTVRYWFILLIVVCFSVAAIGQSGSTQEAPTQQKKDEAKSVPPSSIAPPPPPQQHGQTDGSCKIPAWTDPFWSNWALVIVGIVTAWIALGTLKDIKQQTSTATISADAAKKSAEMAEASLKLGERADVLLDAASLVYGQDLSGKDARVVVQFKNFGRTKAVNVRLKLNLVTEGIPETDHTNIPTISMGAGEVKEISSQKFVQFMTEVMARKIFAAETSLSFEGEACYQDIFGTPHRSYYTGTWNVGTNRFHIKKQESD